jgi:hypothetical protein
LSEVNHEKYLRSEGWKARERRSHLGLFSENLIILDKGMLMSAFMDVLIKKIGG